MEQDPAPRTTSTAAHETVDSTNDPNAVTDTWASFVANVEGAIRLHNTAAAEVAGVLGAKPGVELASTGGEE
jgi:hypothetical protein